MLGLVELVDDEFDRAAAGGDGLAEARDDRGVVPAHELGPRDRDRGRDLDGAEERRERAGGRGVVVAEQPEPLLGRRGRRVRVHGVDDGGAERAAAGDGDEPSRGDLAKELGRGIR